VPVTTGLLSAEEIIRLNRSEREDRDGAIGNDNQISASCQPKKATDVHSHALVIVAPFGG